MTGSIKHTEFKNVVIICCLSLALAVVFGAFGAHLLEDKLSEHYMGVYKTGNFYHFIQSLGWLLLIVVARQFGIHELRWTNLLFGLGIFLFCASLYILSFNEYIEMPGLRKLGAITPIGGLCFIAAWLTAAYRIYKR